MSGRGQLNLIVSEPAHAAAACVGSKEHAAKALPILAAEHVFKADDAANPYAQLLTSEIFLLLRCQGAKHPARFQAGVRHQRIYQLEATGLGKLLPLRVEIKRAEKIDPDGYLDVLRGRLTSVNKFNRDVWIVFKVIDRPFSSVDVSFKLHLGMALRERHQLSVLIDGLRANMHRFVGLHDGHDQNKGPHCGNRHLEKCQPSQISGGLCHLLLGKQIVSSLLCCDLLGQRCSTRFSPFKILKAFNSVSFSLTLGLSRRSLRCRDTGGAGQGRNEGCGDQSKFQGCLPSFAARHSTSFYGVTS